MRPKAVLGFFLCLVAFSACAASRHLSAAGVARQAPDCGEPIHGADALLKQGATVLLGEVHGTREIPRSVGDLTCAAVVKGLRVRVGLELPHEDQPLLERYLASRGEANDRATFLASKTWTHPFQTGKTSAEMFALIDRLRQLEQAHPNPRLFVFFFDTTTFNGPRGRDAAMAEVIVGERAKSPGDLILVLVGNAHSPKVKDKQFDLPFEPMGAQLAQQITGLSTLKVRYRSGQTWACFGPQPSDCGVHRVSGSGLERRAIDLGSRSEGYDGVLDVGTISASPPFLPLEEPERRGQG